MEIPTYNLFLEVAKGLPIDDIASLCQTNRRYANFCRDPNFWRDLIITSFDENIIDATREDYDFLYLLNQFVDLYPDLVEDEYNGWLSGVKSFHVFKVKTENVLSGKIFEAYTSAGAKLQALSLADEDDVFTTPIISTNIIEIYNLEDKQGTENLRFPRHIIGAIESFENQSTNPFSYYAFIDKVKSHTDVMEFYQSKTRLGALLFAYQTSQNKAIITPMIATIMDAIAYSNNPIDQVINNMESILDGVPRILEAPNLVFY